MSALPEPQLPSPIGHPLEEGLAISLSGGGYRAMLFHAGSLWRMLELELLGGSDISCQPRIGSAFHLPPISRISSVSGGSMISALLGIHWLEIAPDKVNAVERYIERVVNPLRAQASQTLVARNQVGKMKLIWNILMPGSVSEHVEKAFVKYLYGEKTLQDLPDFPIFILNASNLQSGALWRFQKSAMRDYRVGQVKRPRLPIAKAVAASAAFPPVLAPCELLLKPGEMVSNEAGQRDELGFEPYTTRVQLADGGAYDNLGLETTFKRFSTLLVSDAGAPFFPSPSVGRDWVQQATRSMSIMDRQVGALRKISLMTAFKAQTRRGAYWSIDLHPDKISCANALSCDPAHVVELANVGTSMGAMTNTLQERLINWGYAATDGAIRTHMHTQCTIPAKFPYPATGI